MGPLLDTVLVCAVGTILVIRTQLWLTNYPQLGGHGLHIAHMLWGGLAMLVAIVVLLTFINTTARQVGAVLGGIGFGFFIDELGKFLTSDNNYFFKPTAAIMYIFFIGFYLGARALRQRRRWSQPEYLVNALELAKDAATQRMDEDERRRALEFLARADQSDPAVGPLRTLLESVPVRAKRTPWVGQRLLAGLRNRYYRLCRNRWFVRVVTALFVLWALGTIVEIASAIWTLTAELTHQHEFPLGRPVRSKPGNLDFVQWANLGSSILSGLFVFWGLFLLRRSRLAAYEMFERALLVSLFLTQVFVFIETQFGACLGFLLSVLLLVTVRFMQHRERELEAGSLAAEERGPALASPLPA